MRARGRLQLLNLSGAPLPVAEWAGGSATLSLAQKRVHESDAVLLAELLQRHASNPNPNPRPNPNPNPHPNPNRHSHAHPNPKR